MGENIPGGNFLIEIFRREFTRGKSDWWELFGWEFSIGICIEIVLTTKTGTYHRYYHKFGKHSCLKISVEFD